eukprot:COSAG01_NODE_33952_length_555_cov_89.046053_1_plen_130_part_01
MPRPMWLAVAVAWQVAVLSRDTVPQADHQERSQVVGRPRGVGGAPVRWCSLHGSRAPAARQLREGGAGRHTASESLAGGQRAHHDHHAAAQGGTAARRRRGIMARPQRGHTPTIPNPDGQVPSHTSRHRA